MYNSLILILFGKKWRVILINEYPKCGASWLKKMLGELLEEDGYFINRTKDEIPFIKPKYFIQRHWMRHSNHIAKTIIVIRDPRDVYNSFYFFENYYQSSSSKRALYGFNKNDNDDINMFRYLQSKLLQPKASPPFFSYRQFWDKYKNDKSVLFTKYLFFQNPVVY